MRLYQPGDYAEFAGWYEARGEVAPPPRFLPSVGFLEPGVAAGFLFSTDAAVCWVDYFVSNPAAPFMLRGRALASIAKALISEAGNRGYEAILVTSREPGILRQADRMAFKPLGNFAMMCRATVPVEPAYPDDSAKE